MDTEQTDRTNGAENAAKTPARKGRKNGSASLLKAKHVLDDVVGHLEAFPELRQETAKLRDRVLATLLETERQAGPVS